MYIYTHIQSIWVVPFFNKTLAPEKWLFSGGKKRSSGTTRNQKNASDRRPVMFHKRPVMFHKRPVMFHKRPVMFH